MDLLQSIAVYIKEPLVAKAIITIVVILVLLIIKRVFFGMIDRRVKAAKSIYSWKKTVSMLVLIVGIIAVIRIWLGGFASLATYAGLLSAGIAIALKDMLANLAGWLFIMWRKPFAVGDRIQIGDSAGDVIDMRPFQFTLLEMGKWVRADQPTGRFVFIPNGVVFSQPVINYDTGFKYIWNEISVTISFDSNWQKATEIMKKSVAVHCMQVTPNIEHEIKQAVSKYFIGDNKLQPDVFVNIADNGIALTARYLTEVRSRRAASEEIQKDILTEFGAATDLTFADVNSITISMNKG